MLRENRTNESMSYTLKIKLFVFGIRWWRSTNSLITTATARCNGFLSASVPIYECSRRLVKKWWVTLILAASLHGDCSGGRRARFSGVASLYAHNATAQRAIVWTQQVSSTVDSMRRICRCQKRLLVRRRIACIIYDIVYHSAILSCELLLGVKRDGNLIRFYFDATRCRSARCTRWSIRQML